MKNVGLSDEFSFIYHPCGLASSGWRKKTVFRQTNKGFLKIMKKKTIRNGIPLFLIPVIILSVMTCCSSQRTMRITSDPLLGYWKTDRDIIVSIHLQQGSELVAEIVSAPGFFSNDIGAGNLIMHNIRQSTVGYSGLFIMPGTEKPVKVEIRFANRNTIVFNTGDKRARGNKMVWHRVSNFQPTNP